MRISLAGGIDRETIDRVADGPGRRRLVRRRGGACCARPTSCTTTSTISDDTWAALAEAYDEKQLIEIPMLVGQYHMVAFALNSLGVEQDEGLEDLPG